MARRRRRHSTETPRYYWMDTYGDMITLVLCFFVMLYAYSGMNSSGKEELVSALSGRAVPISYPIDLGISGVYVPELPPFDGDESYTVIAPDATTKPNHSFVPSEIDPEQQERNEEFDKLYEMLADYIDDQDIDAMGVDKDGTAITMSFLDSVFFESGQAELLPASLEILDEVIPFLSTFQPIIESIRVEGHTDNIPIQTSQFPNNWWLSVTRAANVVEYLRINSDIAPEKLSVDGRAEYHPVASNDTPEGRAQNRRVEIVITEQVLP